MKKLFGVWALLAALTLVIGGCSSDDSKSSPDSAASPVSAAKQGDPSKPDPRTAGWDIHGYPINGGPKGADGSTGNNLDRHFCAHNQDRRCPVGSYVGPFTGYHDGHGYWDANGRPVHGGPVGADGSTGNNLTQEHCARNEDPACPRGSYVGPNAQRDPRGGPHYVKCEGTICTNPNHGAGTDPKENGGDSGAHGVWDANGNPIAGGPTGADGSTGNNRTRQYCAANQDPGCPAGSYIAPAQPGPPEPGQNQMQGPGEQKNDDQNNDNQNNNDQNDDDQNDNDQGGDQNNDQGGDDQGGDQNNDQGGDDQGGDDQGGDQNNDQGGDDN
ncbi:Mesocentin [Gordonia crocea]|uniref:Lipoprotein n=1 Tax=Gordonia crocea TaxID=589162 RepID=A0A7I9UZU2_9ACTN|nr:Mesocentin [Gordonia crocea]GED98697.1 hypothetical protein nbrc107697_27360 [Gordonia crocea]